MRKETLNTFSEGMVMDLNPLTTPNNVLTNCLNGTILTYNGNEYLLQNDMGNGRVESAYLPAGYVPVGVTEFGGIIYVVSYNPQLDLSQIGSFPSPERNITSDELGANKQELSNNDFGFTDEYKGASVFYVQKDLCQDKLNPGDKFIVYSKGGDITGNADRLTSLTSNADTPISPKTRLVNLSLATITEEGKIVKLSRLIKYEINNGSYKYIIPEMDYNSDGTPNIDRYRTITQSPYNVFNSKVSGKLLLIAELLTVDSFDVTTDVSFESIPESENKKVAVKVFMNYESTNNDINLFGVEGSAKSSNSSYPIKISSNNGNNGPECYYKWNPAPGSNGGTKENEATLGTVESYDVINKPDCDIFWELTPCMDFGPISYLKRSGVIELDKVGTGYTALYQWRYFVDNNTIQINWGLQSYPEPNHEILGVRFIMSAYDGKDGNTNIIKTLSYKVSNKKSYNGSFTETIPFDVPFYQFESGDNLVTTLSRDRLYFVTIEVQYAQTSTTNDKSKYKYFHRYLYTANVFNKEYIEGIVTDFKELQPQLNVTVNTEGEFNLTEQFEPEAKLGLLVSKTVLDSDSETMCIKQNHFKMNLSLNNNPTIIKDYNIFSLNNPENISIEITKSNKSIDFSNCSKPIFTGVDHEHKEDWLKLEEDTNYDGTSLTFSAGTDAIDKQWGFYVGDIQQDYTIPIDIVQYIKAFAHLTRESVSYNGIIHPIAYNASTFAQYNLLKRKDGNSDQYYFISNGVAAFGQYEIGGHSGQEQYYDITSGDLENENRSKKHDNLATYFNEDYCQSAMKKSWTSVTGTICACIFAYLQDKVTFMAPMGKSKVLTSWPWYPMKETFKKGNNKWVYDPHTYKHTQEIGQFLGTKKKDWSHWGTRDNNRKANFLNIFTPVFVFMKGKNGKWIPINMVTKLGIQTQTQTAELSPTQVLEFDDVHNYAGYSPNRYYISSPMDSRNVPQSNLQKRRSNLNLAMSFKNIYTVFATILNQLYKFEKGTSIQQLYIPTSAYYIPNYNVAYNIDIQSCFADDAVININIKTETGEIQLNSTLKDELNTKNKIITNNHIDVLETPDDFDNNVEPIITKECTTNTFVYSNKNTGIELYSKIDEQNRTNFGAIVTTNDGQQFTSYKDRLYENKVYELIDGEPIEITDTFKFKNITRWTIENEGTANEFYKAVQPEVVELLNTQNMRDRFAIEEDTGMLIMDESGHIGEPSVRMFRDNVAGEGGDGSFGNFSNLAPIDFLQCWNDT